MSSKPTSFIDWCPDGDPEKVIQPSTALAHAGYISGQVPVAQHFNWLLYTLDRWVRWLDEASDLNLVQGTFNGARPLSVRMVGGGNWSYAAGTGVLTWSAAWNLSIPGVPLAANNVVAGSATMSDGQCAYVTANLPFNTTGDLANGDPTITNITNILGVQVGMAIYGSGVAAGATVSSISDDTVTMSANATGDNTGAALTFGFSGNLSVAVAIESSIDPTDGRKIVFARRSGAQVFMGVPGNTMMLQDGQKLPLMENPDIFTALAGEALTAGQVVYVSPGAADGGRTAGSVYKTDAGSTNGAIRSHAVGIVLASVSSGSSAVIVTHGVVRAVTSITAGVPYYLNPSTTGAMTPTAPTTAGQYLAKIGTALSSTAFLINIEPPTMIPTTMAYRTAMSNCLASTYLTADFRLAPTTNGGVICLPAVGTSSGDFVCVVPLMRPEVGTIVTAQMIARPPDDAPTDTTITIKKGRNVGSPVQVAGGLWSGFTDLGAVSGSIYHLYDLGTVSSGDLIAGDTLIANITSEWDTTSDEFTIIGFIMNITPVGSSQIMAG